MRSDCWLGRAVLESAWKRALQSGRTGRHRVLHAVQSDRWEHSSWLCEPAERFDVAPTSDRALDAFDEEDGNDC